MALAVVVPGHAVGIGTQVAKQHKTCRQQVACALWVLFWPCVVWSPSVVGVGPPDWPMDFVLQCEEK